VRLLAAAGARLEVVEDRTDDAELRRVGQTLVDVIRLAAVLPVRHQPDLRYPRIPLAPLP
jgi:hypothetical protein